MPKLQNAAMRTMQQLMQPSYIRAEALALAFNITPHGSLMRTLTINSFLGNHSITNVYGAPAYTEDDLNLLSSAPGVMAECLETISKTNCGKLKCSCKLKCYFNQEHSACMVPED